MPIVRVGSVSYMDGQKSRDVHLGVLINSDMFIGTLMRGQQCASLFGCSTYTMRQVKAGRISLVGWMELVEIPMLGTTYSTITNLMLRTNYVDGRYLDVQQGIQ